MNKGGATVATATTVKAAKVRGGGRRRGGRMRRGDIRTALLAILVEEPGHGYDVIQRLEEKTAGAWRPSPGSVYPTLQLLEDEGLVRSVERDGKRVFEITDAGSGRSDRAHRRPRAELRGRSPGATTPASATSATRSANSSSRPSRCATSGNQEQVERMLEILKRARKEIYTMLAED